MFKPGSKLYAIRKHKCPKCHQGDLFKSSLISLEGIYNMYEKCPECGQDFELEPGFYWGAMYIGYFLSSVYMLSGTGICILLFGLTATQSFALTIFIGIIIVPLLARLSRSIWINTVVHFNKSVATAVKAKNK